MIDYALLMNVSRVYMQYLYKHVKADDKCNEYII